MLALEMAFSTPADALCSPSTSVAKSASPSHTSVTQHIVVSHVTVTAASKNGDSAVILTLFNGTAHAILVHSVASSVARSDMVMIDNNMCMGNNTMIRLTDIYIARDWTQKLSYKAQGAMLIGLRQTLKKGQQIPLSITWSENISNSKLHTTLVTALVVRPPNGLQFGGQMPGMKM
jgi:copper(I)-binding protein